MLKQSPQILASEEKTTTSPWPSAIEDEGVSVERLQTNFELQNTFVGQMKLMVIIHATVCCFSDLFVLELCKAVNGLWILVRSQCFGALKLSSMHPSVPDLKYQKLLCLPFFSSLMFMPFSLES